MDEEQRQFIESLYLEMYNKLIVFANCAFPEEGLAEESVQETFRIACQKADQICDSENPRGWLVNTLKFTIRNMRRSRESSQQLLSRYLALQTESITYSVDAVSLEVLYGPFGRIQAGQGNGRGRQISFADGRGQRHYRSCL